jgi:hypothetical protein
VQRKAVAGRDPTEHELDEAGACADGCAAGGRRIKLQARMTIQNRDRKHNHVNVDGSIEIRGKARLLVLQTARP